MDIRSHNRTAWDKAVEEKSPWSIPVTPEVTAAARLGEWHIILTPTIPVPRAWFPDDLHGVEVLCLASGGGQQGPVLAAAGATVTVFDNSRANWRRIATSPAAMAWPSARSRGICAICRFSPMPAST